MYEYKNFRRIQYGNDIVGDAIFIPVCPNCGRFVKADKKVRIREVDGRIMDTNATCKKCGRVNMPFEGYY